MNKQGKNIIGIVLVIFILLVAAFLVWGYVGGQEAKKVGVTCDIGAGTGNTFCWKWHTNALGQLGEGINNAING